MSNLDGDYTEMMSIDNAESRSLFAMNTFADRLRWALKKKGISQSELARICKIHRATVSLWLTGRTKEIEGTNLANVAEALAVRPSWLATGKGEREYQEATLEFTTSYSLNAGPIGTPIIAWEKPEDLPEGEFVIVSRYDIHVAAGNGHVVYDELEHEQGQAYRSSSVRNLATKASNLMTVYAKGESMEPSIYEGDALLVDRGQTTVKDRQVYILRYGNEIRVKRLFLRPDGGLRIVSDNSSAFPEEVITGEEMKHIEIIGRVVERSGRM